MNQIGGTHYDDMGIEPRTVIKANNMCFDSGNALKYLMRYKAKGNPIADLKKVLWYTEQLIKELELEQEVNEEKTNNEMTESMKQTCHLFGCGKLAEPFTNACKDHITESRQDWSPCG